MIEIISPDIVRMVGSPGCKSFAPSGAIAPVANETTPRLLKNVAAILTCSLCTKSDTTPSLFDDDTLTGTDSTTQTPTTNVSLFRFGTFVHENGNNSNVFRRTRAACLTARPLSFGWFSFSLSDDPTSVVSRTRLKSRSVHSLKLASGSSL